MTGSMLELGAMFKIKLTTWMIREDKNCDLEVRGGDPGAPGEEKAGHLALPPLRVPPRLRRRCLFLRLPARLVHL